MKNYLWVFIIGAIAFISLFFFIVSFSRDLFLVKKLKKKKQVLSINFLLLVGSVVDVSLIIYLFIMVKNQIDALSYAN